MYVRTNAVGTKSGGVYIRTNAGGTKKEGVYVRTRVPWTKSWTCTFEHGFHFKKNMICIPAAVLKFFNTNLNSPYNLDEFNVILKTLNAREESII